MNAIFIGWSVLCWSGLSGFLFVRGGRTVRRDRSNSSCVFLGEGWSYSMVGLNFIVLIK